MAIIESPTSTYIYIEVLTVLPLDSLQKQVQALENELRETNKIQRPPIDGAVQPVNTEKILYKFYTKVLNVQVKEAYLSSIRFSS